MSSPPNTFPDPIEGTPPVLNSESYAGPVEILTAPPPKPFPAWSGWDVLAVFGFSLLIVFLFMTVAIVVTFFVHGNGGSPMSDIKAYIPVAIAAQAASYPVILLFIFFLVRSRANAPFGTSISWNWPRMTAPLYVIGGFALAFAVDRLARFLPMPKSLPLDEYFTDATSAYLMAGLGVVLAPLMEEILFRGLLYPVLRRWAGVVISVLLTALAFASIHLSQLGYAWGPALSIFIVGVVFTVVRERTHSLAASFLTHWGYNLALFGAIWFSSDHFRHLEKITGQ